MMATIKHADLAQHEDGDEVDGVKLGAEFAEMKDALLGDDAADQEGDQENDGNGLPGHAVELIDGRGEPVLARAGDDAERGETDSAQHVGEQHQIAAEPGGGPADGGQRADDPVLFGSGFAGSRLTPCISLSRPRSCGGSPTITGSRPVELQARVRRSNSQAPNVSNSRTPAMSIETFFACAASPATRSTSVSSSLAFAAVHEPAAGELQTLAFQLTCEQRLNHGHSSSGPVQGAAVDVASEAAITPARDWRISCGRG